MTDDIDPKRLRITEEGRKLLDTGIRDCPYCKTQPQVEIQVRSGRCCIRCSNLVERYLTDCGGMDTRDWTLERAVRRWNNKVDRIDRRIEKKNRKEDGWRWERVK